MNLSCTNEEKIKLVANPVTRAGRPTAIDGALAVSVISGDSTVIQDPAEPLGFFVVSSNTPGDTTYLIEADADLGAGVVTVQDTVTLTVVGALAANLGLTASAPETK